MASSSEPSAKLPESEALQKECAELEEELSLLRARYEQYFLGVERAPPVHKHAAVRRRIQTLKSVFVRSTSVKFRLQSLHATYITYDRLWTRTLQEIENGTYRRDIFKAKLHAKQREEARLAKEREVREKKRQKADVTAPAAATAGSSAPPGMRPVSSPGFEVPLGAVRPASSPGFTSPAAAKRAPAGAAVALGAAASGGLTDAKVRSIYEAYVNAKKECREDTSKLTFDAVAANLRKQVPDLLKRHNAQEVEFRVVIKDGKASLRAIPKGGK